MTPLAAHDFLKKASRIAAYYGFGSLQTSLSTKETPPATKIELSPELEREPLNHLSLKVARALPFDKETLSRPYFFYHAFPGKQIRSAQLQNAFGISAVNLGKSIGEVLVLKTALSILEDTGIKSVTVYLNSIGDRDSSARFSRELGNQLKRNADMLSEPCREALKRDPFDALELLNRETHPLKESLPRPIHFLSEPSRRHLREIIEFLEFTHVPYTLEDCLIGNRDAYSQTLFEIRNADAHDTEHVLVRGGRLDELSRRSFKVTLPMVHALFTFKGRSTTPPPIRVKSPRFFLIQLGFAAKLFALSILESLRKAHIPVRQSMEHDGLREQMERARISGASYLLILGQREVIDKTVIIRNMNSQAQEIIPIVRLPAFLKTKLLF
jgi:histidyl-tRNA synthetase